jgi:RND family efflux transporter MFP subunit
MTRGAKAGLWILVALVIIVVFATTAARRMQKTEVQSIESIQTSEGVPVNVVVARAIPVEDWRQFVGTAEGSDQVDLSADFRTRVEAVHVGVGDEVRAGKVVVSLDSYDPGRAMLNLEATRSQYETVRADSIRMEELFKSGAVSQQDLDHVRAQSQAARAQFLTARRAVRLDTPIGGMVTAVNVEAGDYAEGGQTLVTIAAYYRIRIRLELSDAERALVETGQKVRAAIPAGRGADGDASAGYLYGAVVRAALSADPETRLFPVEVIVENPDRRLKPGGLVAPEVLVAASDDQPVIPRVALVRHDGDEMVFVVTQSAGEALAATREVSRGVGNEELLSVAGDLRVGEQVVVWGQSKLRDGARVKINQDLTAEYYGSKH